MLSKSAWWIALQLVHRPARLMSQLTLLDEGKLRRRQRLVD